MAVLPTKEKLFDIEEITMGSASETRYRSKNRFVWWIVVILCVAGAVLSLFRWMNQKSVGTIVQEGISQGDMPQENTAEMVRYKGKYFTFDYLAHYQVRSVNTVNYPVLEQVLLVEPSIEGRKISVVAQEIAAETLKEYPGFRMRSQDNMTYQQENLIKGGWEYVLFTKTSSVFEVGVFFRKGNIAKSIVLSSPVKLDGLREELLQLLESQNR